MNPSQKPLQFSATPGSVFILMLKYIGCMFLPIFGFVLWYRIYMRWLSSNLTVNGSSVKFEVDFMDTFVFLIIQWFFTFITLGIYTFWAVPKIIGYATDHIEYDTAPSNEPVNPAPIETPQTTPPVIQ